MKLTVRRIRPIDIGAVFKMSMDFAREVELPYPALDEAELERKMLFILTNKDNPTYAHLIAYDGKKPAGFFMGYVADHEYGRPSRVGVAQELYVEPKKRGGQVAMALMREAYRIGKEQGIESFECVGSYGGTEKMWTKFGFTMHLAYGYLSPEEAERRFGTKGENKNARSS